MSDHRMTRFGTSDVPPGAEPLNKQPKALNQWRNFEPTWFWHWLLVLTTLVFAIGLPMATSKKIEMVPFLLLVFVLGLLVEILRLFHKQKLKNLDA